MAVAWILGAAALLVAVGLLAYTLGSRRAAQQFEETLATLTQLRDLTAKLPGTVYQMLHRRDGSVRLAFVSEGAKKLYGLEPQAVAADPSQLLQGVHPDDLQMAREALDSASRDGTPWVAEYRVIQSDGSERWHANAAVPLTQDSGDLLWHGFVADVTERKAGEVEVQKLAFYDPLTGLPNRRLLMDRLQKSLAASRRSRAHVAVFLMDLDKFKLVNDTFGHDNGDLYLRTVAERMSTCLRAGDTAARFAGDEFVVLLDSLSPNADEALVQTQAVAEKLLRQFQEPYQLGTHSHIGGMSIGVCLSGEADAALELLKRADIAAYSVKDSGGNALRFFAPEMQAAVDARVKMAIEFRKAMLEHQFMLLYQDQVDAKGQLIGAEVLLRWEHPELGLVAPDSFVPHAEDTGLIHPLGEWVLEEACRKLADWSQRVETRHMTISVNVSAKQFQHVGFVASVTDVLQRTGAPPDRLTLELTESVMVTALDEVVAKMLTLRERGVALSLDDFGTGYSSLAYLRQLPLNELKIDKSFVRDIIKSSNISIAKSIIALGQGMGLQVVAEGVENFAQLEILLQLGCDRYQGYHFGRPKTIEQFERLFEPDLLLPSTLE